MIKKSISIFFLFFLITNISFSQKLELGIKAGPNSATQKLNSITGIESVTGYHVGGFLFFKLPILFGIQVEGQYSTQGSEFQVNQIINKNNLSYINFPILIRKIRLLLLVSVHVLRRPFSFYIGAYKNGIYICAECRTFGPESEISFCISSYMY